MKKVMIKYNIEIPEDKLDRYCKKIRVGRNSAAIEFKQLAEIHGRKAIYDIIEDRINS